MPLPGFVAITAMRDGLFVRIKDKRFQIPWGQIEEDFLAPLAVAIEQARQHGLLPPRNGAIEREILRLAPAPAAASAAAPTVTQTHEEDDPRVAPAASSPAVHQKALDVVIADGYTPEQAAAVVKREGADYIVKMAAERDARRAAQAAAEAAQPPPPSRIHPAR